MELSWHTKLRITACLALGVLLMGFGGWKLVAPDDPILPVSLYTISPTALDIIAIFALAFITGLIAYFLAWPYGHCIAALAVPAGLSFWAIRTGDVASLLQINSAIPQRQIIYNTFKFEGLFWVALVAAGLLGALAARKLARQKPKSPLPDFDSSDSTNSFNIVLAIFGAALVARFVINILARDIMIPDPRLGAVIGQPATGQIAFAVFTAFGIAAFAAKNFLNANYIWPILGQAFLVFSNMLAYGKHDIIKYFAENHPAVLFVTPAAAIVPLQMIAFGTLGSVTGYWIAIRYKYWRQHKH